MRPRPRPAAVPTIECDPAAARERLTAAGVEVRAGNTAHERWRAERGDAVAVAYDDKVVVQGARPTDLVALLRDGGGRAHVYFDGASRGNPGPAAVGWALVTGDGVVSEGGERIGETTNNRAEYAALERALEVARDRGFDEVEPGHPHAATQLFDFRPELFHVQHRATSYYRATHDRALGCPLMHMGSNSTPILRMPAGEVKNPFPDSAISAQNEKDASVCGAPNEESRPFERLFSLIL